MLNHARISFSSLVCFWLMHVSWVFPSITFLIRPTLPFFLSFFFPVYTQECESKNSLQGRGKGFSLSDLSLPFIAPFAQSFPAPPFPFSVSLVPPFLPSCSSKHLHFLFKPLLVVYWSVIAGSLDVKQERYYCTKTSLLNVIWRPFLYNFLFQGLSKEDVSVFYPSIFLN